MGEDIKMFQMSSKSLNLFLQDLGIKLFVLWPFLFIPPQTWPQLQQDCRSPRESLEIRRRNQIMLNNDPDVSLFICYK